MGTKNDPGQFDCYAAALPDEPMFVLLARDPLAPYLVRIWASLRARRPLTAHALLEVVIQEHIQYDRTGMPEPRKAAEAAGCAVDMQAWRKANDGAWRHRARNDPETEQRAEAIYNTFPYDEPGEKPAGVPGGNSPKQDEARRLAEAGYGVEVGTGRLVPPPGSAERAALDAECH